MVKVADLKIAGFKEVVLTVERFKVEASTVALFESQGSKWQD